MSWPLPTPGVGSIGFGEKLFFAAVRGGVVAKETSATPFDSMIGAPPSSTTLRLPAKAMTWLGQLLGLGAVRRRLEPVVGLHER